ncbi:hypothetical protein GIB67_027099 [Kingdonia uniflora]|uniref:VQ domain-containing protein n=1 Tax=Kingdonia uniflora TaxID=39325 RepID=A0A7J7P2K8_9MAGN|nr:hypothetical protein GIB67_027099 [Kingdonia uniflora]
MSPSKFYDDQQGRREMHGPRPSVLKISKDSHPIHKVIHTKPRDFMSLVQKLTGMSRPDDDGGDVHVQPKSQDAQKFPVHDMRSVGHHDETSSSSVVTDENCGATTDVQVSSSSVSPIFESPNNYLSDIPLFTPNSLDFLCSADRPYYRYPDLMFSSPNMSSSMSPSVLEVMKGFQDY